MKDVNGVWVGYGLNDTGAQVTKIQHRLLKAFPANSKAVTLGVTESGVFDQATVTALENVQPFLKPAQPATGIANFATQVALGVAAPPPPPPAPRRKIWFFSAPGSGAPWWVGPSFDVGEWVKSVLGIQHQPVSFPIGGYLGLLGGDPGLSYNQVIAAEGAELERLLSINPDVIEALAQIAAGHPEQVEVELWMSAYSQSSDGMKVAVNRLFGDGGRFAALRSRINGLLLFGDPTRQPGVTKVGNNPVGWGISRKVFPAWINDLTWSITAEGPGAPDFYAACNDEIRPLFYEVIVGASTSLSFFEHIAMIIIPILLNTFGPLLGGLTGGALTPILSLLTGLSGGLIGQAVSAATPAGEIDPTDAAVQAKLTQLFTLQGIIGNIPALITLLGALPGLGAHGSYYEPHPEFGGRTGLQVACDAVASFHR